MTEKFLSKVEREVKSTDTSRLPQYVRTNDIGTATKLNNEIVYYKSHVMRKPAFCICENKDADQLRGNREADQRLCFLYIDSTIPLLSKPEISSL